MDDYYSQIIEAVRTIESGKCPSINISPILNKHNCMQWLKMGYPSQYNTHNSLLNRLIVRERYQACASVFSDLENVPYAVIKGAVLSAVAYNDFSLRRSSDIDLLIDRSCVDVVKKVLLKHNFVQGYIQDGQICKYERKDVIFYSALTHQMAPFVKMTNSSLIPYIAIDVNVDIFWGESNCLINMKDFLSHREDILIAGVACKTLSPIYAFISLCMHHFKDMNSLFLLADRGMKMDKLCDILYFLKATRLDIEELIDIATKLNVIDYLYYCLFYTNLLCPNNILQPYINSFKHKIDQDLTPFFGLTKDERQKWEIPFEDRLFNPNFKTQFISLLPQWKKEKIKVNEMYM